MKNFQTKAVCKGCKHEFKVAFDESEDWRYVAIPIECPKCESQIEVQCKRMFIGKQVYTRTKMIKHTGKLLSLLAEASPRSPRRVRH